MSQGPEYAGDISCRAAWALLEADRRAQLFDVRTVAEWTFVGAPDLSGLKREVHCVEWQSYPQTAPNPAFVATVSAKADAAGADRETPIFFLCRSGARSRAAAIAMTKAGFARAYNVAGGFEGDLDEAKHRGARNGWKAEGLPWRQS